LGAVTAEHDAIEAYWVSANARDWASFARLLSPVVVYEVPQTRERVRGREPYVQFNAEYPGDWRAEVVRVVGEAGRGASWTHFVVGGEQMDGIAFFDFDDEGLIERVTDFWPEPYEPPPGREHLVERW
jgi:hypothetical protein